MNDGNKPLIVCMRSELPIRHGRAVLNDDQAKEIFRWKPFPDLKERDRAGYLARLFGVSVKTIRDIWVGRTWYRATFNLDPQKPVEAERLLKRPGRPRGVKDSKPRAKKLDERQYKNKKVFTETRIPRPVPLMIPRPVMSTNEPSSGYVPHVHDIQAAVPIGEPASEEDRYFVDSLLSFSSKSLENISEAADLTPQIQETLPCTVAPWQDPFELNWNITSLDLASSPSGLVHKIDLQLIAGRRRSSLAAAESVYLLSDFPMDDTVAVF